MASPLDIVNLAFAHLGHQSGISSIDPPEGSVYADDAARFYGLTRDSMLEQAEWTFAARRVNLTPLAGTPPDTWLFQYAWPSNLALKVWRIMAPGDSLAPLQPDPRWNESPIISPVRPTPDNRAHEFVLETLANGSKVIYCNVEDAIGVFTWQVTDTTRFTPGFVNAMSYELAAKLAGPVIKGKEGRAVALQLRRELMQVHWPQALGSDANQARVSSYDKFTPSGISARM